MMNVKIGRKIFYDLITGNVILNTGEREGSVVDTTIEQDIASFKDLNERVRSTFDVIELNHGELSGDFSSSNGVRVNLTTKTLEFSYPDPNVPSVEPVYQAPLSEQLQILEERQSATENALLDLLLGGM
jgi:hypothetical protein